MFASVQYLLAGLPVVSTPSLGGRDEFFSRDYVRIVEPNPDAVAAGVKELIAEGPDGREIRRRTLIRLDAHRRRFIDHVQGIFAAEGESRRFEDDWPRVFRHRMTDWSLSGPARRRDIARHNAAILDAVERAVPHPLTPEVISK